MSELLGQVEIAEIINQAKKANVNLYIDQNKLKFKAEKGALTGELKDKLSQNKQSIIRYIQQHENEFDFNVLKSPKPLRIPASFSQRRIWFLHQLEGGSSQYNIAFQIPLPGILDVDAFKKALQTILERHEVLRTRFSEGEGEVYQEIQENVKLPFKESDLSRFSIEEKKLKVDELVKLDSHASFDLGKDILIRTHLLKLSDEEYLLLFNVHHIVSDGWSMNILQKEFELLYDAFSNNLQSPLQPLAIQYADYAHWQRQWLQGNVLEDQLNYWRKRLQGIPQVHSLPLDHPRPINQTFEGINFKRFIGIDLFRNIQELCQEEKVTLFMFLQSAFSLLLARYSGASDIVMGTPVAGRTHVDVENLIGFFVNTLVLRTKVDVDHSFSDYLQVCKQNILDAYTFQNMPFEILVDKLKPNRNLAYSPVFQIMFILENAREDSLDHSGPSNQQSYDAQIKFDLSLCIGVSTQELSLTWSYNNCLFSEKTIQELARCYEVLLESIVRTPDSHVDSLKLLDSKQHETLLAIATQSENTRDQHTIVTQFEQLVLNVGDKTAIVYKDKTMSYRGLNARANQLAHYLIEMQVQSDDLIAISMDRSEDLIIAILGILKAGAAYVPIDPAYPVSRRDYMLEDSGAKIILTQQNYSSNLLSTDKQFIILDDPKDLKILSSYSINNPVQRAKPGGLAYVNYTSGSTGLANGVLVEHDSVIRLVLNNDYVPLNEETIMLQASSISFDVATFEIWGSLLNAGCLVLYPDLLIDIAVLNQVLLQHRVNTAWLTSGLFEQWSHELPKGASLKWLLAGGDILNPSAVARVIKGVPGVKVINGYGPTENTTFSTCYEVPDDIDYRRSIPIGTAIKGSSVYVLNNQKQLAPYGAVGELYVGGRGVARGYHNRPELNAERFIQSKFIEGERLYKTGDQVRWHADGYLEFFGRIDQQIKLRGYRVELGEIEYQLRQHALLEDAVTLIRMDDHQDKQLIAYVVSDPVLNSEQVAELKADLHNVLPEYMIPNLFVPVQSLPLTANGKVDKRALPEPEVENLIESSYTAPRSDIEKDLCDLWASILKVKRVGVHDNFFSLGGHSLLATRLVSQIRKTLNIEVPLRSLFETPTVSGLAGGLSKKSDTFRLPDIMPVNRIQRLPLSYAQQRIWFIDQLEEGSHQYNIPLQFPIEGELSLKAFEAALEALLHRHEVLRTKFEESQGEVEQVIVQKPDIPFSFLDLSSLTESQQYQKVKDYARMDARTAFKLSEEIPIRVKLLKLNAKRYMLLFNIHHIASDGWSMKILQEEFEYFYQIFLDDRKPDLAGLKVQYADYAHWQRQWLQGEVLEGQLAYWKRYLHGIPQVHDLPLDMPRPAHQLFEGTSFRHILSDKLCKQINQFCHSQQVTLFMFLQTAFSVILSRYSNNPDIIMGTPIAGRTHADLDPLIGFFVNTLVLRTDLSNNPAFKDLLFQQKQHILDAYTYQHVPFEMLVDELNPVRSLSYSPLFQIMFILQNNEQISAPASSINIDEEIDMEVQHDTKFDLTLTVREVDGKLVFGWAFNNSIFVIDSIRGMAENFECLLKNIVSNADTPVECFDVVSNRQKKLLQSWNDTSLKYPDDICLHQLFEQQVEKTPDNIAIIDSGSKIRYQQLNDNANLLSVNLSKLGVKSGDLVGLYFERCSDAIVALIAILKSGAAYVPLDPAYPESRLAHLIEDSGIDVLLTHKPLSSNALKLPGHHQVQIINVNDAINDLKQYKNIQNSKCELNPAQNAYVIYTSGSTGVPKGVMGSHKSMINRIQWMNQSFPIASNEVFCHKTSLSFVDHVAEIFQPLTNGIAVVVIPNELINNIDKFIEAIKLNKITRITLVPSLLKVLLENEAVRGLNSLKYIISSGEPLTISVVKLFYQQLPKCKLINIYGSTEVAADVSCFSADQQNLIDYMRYFKSSSASVSVSSEKIHINNSCSDNKITSPNVNLEKLAPKFSETNIPHQAISMQDYIEHLNKNVLPYLINVSSQHYIGHMTSALPDFMPELSKLVSALNQNVVKVETSKSLTLLERQVLAMIHKLFFGFPDLYYKQYCQDPMHMFGIVSSGGTTANVTALWCARNKALIAAGFSKDQLVKHGAIYALNALGYKDAVIIGTRLLHYSFRKTASLIGIGEDNILIVDQDSNQKLSIKSLNHHIKQCRLNKRFIIAMVGIAGATETGIIDPLHKMAEIAEKNDIHFHVDAAWGGALAFSEQYKPKLSGIERADSITFCAHKQLYIPQGMSLCLFKDTSSMSSISTHAYYQAQKGSYDFGQYTLEGSRSAASLFLHASLHLLGRDGYASLINKNMTKAKFFEKTVKESDCFQLIGKPDMNIINYRYIPIKFRLRSSTRFSEEENIFLNEAVERIHKRQFEKGDTFVSKTKVLNNKYSEHPVSVFRVVISNPKTDETSLKEVLNDQLSIAQEIFENGDMDYETIQQSVNTPISTDAAELEHWSVPIGRPISNTKILILNKQHKLAPLGVTGELCVCGKSLANGYLNQKQLTAEKFINNPYAGQDDKLLYKTGDRARWTNEGYLEYIGREDFQVKIRGNRIELGEVEYQLQQLSMVKEVVVMAKKENNTGSILVAYLILNKTADQGIAHQNNENKCSSNLIDEIKSRLKLKVPEFMLPSKYIFMDEFPLMPNGKLDRIKLSKIDIEIISDNYIKPETEVEIKLQEIWSELLNSSQVSADHNFFELGGHSLLTIKMVSIINSMYQIRLTIRDVFEYPTLRQLANRIENNKSNNSAQWQPIVTLSAKSERKPIYIIPGLGMLSVSFQSLAKSLESQYALKVLEAKGMDPAHSPHKSVDEMVLRYVQAIKQDQKQGPYRVIGYSFGGIVAFEIAKHLEFEGHKVQIILLDSYLSYQRKHNHKPSAKDALVDMMAELFKIDKVLLNKLKDTDNAVEFLLNNDGVKRELVTVHSFPEDGYKEILTGLVNVYLSHFNMMMGYSPTGLLLSSITLFYAEQSLVYQSDMSKVKKYYQSLLSSGQFRMIPTPGNHYTMLNDKNSHLLAKSIRNELDQKNGH